MAATTRRTVVTCDECETPIAEVRDQGVLIRVRHHGEAHVTLITWEQLQMWMVERRALDDRQCVA